MWLTNCLIIPCPRECLVDHCWDGSKLMISLKQLSRHDTFGLLNFWCLDLLQNWSWMPILFLPSPKSYTSYEYLNTRFQPSGVRLGVCHPRVGFELHTTKCLAIHPASNMVNDSNDEQFLWLISPKSPFSFGWLWLLLVPYCQPSFRALKLGGKPLLAIIG